MKRLRSFRRDEGGLGAVEFALIAPALIGMLIGITQLGQLYFARADLRNAVAAGARHAGIFPRPSAAAIATRIRDKVTRINKSTLVGPTVTIVTNQGSFHYADIEVRYPVPLNFVFYKPPPVTLVERRRVFLQPEN